MAENNFAIAFMDINPIAKGHVLVVPKIQVDYLFDLDDDTYHKLWGFVKLVSWYDNEIGYSSRLIDLCFRISN